MSPESASSPAKTGFSTACVHAGSLKGGSAGGVVSPIFPSSAYAYPDASGENTYQRYFNTPNQRIVAEKVAALERGEAGLVFGSGMAAISTLLFSHLRPGDHILFQEDIYGGTRQLIRAELTRFGIHASFARTTEEFAAGIRPDTKALYAESPSNPLLRCIDLQAIAALARSAGALSIVDNTFATPINQTPLESGIDAVVHSATKYLNGHSDLNAGVVVSTAEVIARLTGTAANYGGMLDASACHQVERGMKTLAIRMRQHNENALGLARFLASHPAVDRVHYPGLPDHADHALAARQMRGFGGMLSFELREPDRVEEALRGLRIAKIALSLGGVETLVCVPCLTSHKSLTPEERRRIGISDGLVRVSVGIEDVEDLIADFRAALGR